MIAKQRLQIDCTMIAKQRLQIDCSTLASDCEKTSHFEVIAIALQIRMICEAIFQSSTVREKRQ
jgi:hypothetical protein